MKRIQLLKDLEFSKSISTRSRTVTSLKHGVHWSNFAQTLPGTFWSMESIGEEGSQLKTEIFRLEQVISCSKFW